MPPKKSSSLQYMDSGTVSTVTPPTPQLLKVVGLTKSSKGEYGRVPAAKEVAAAENHGRLLVGEGGQPRLWEALCLALGIDLLPHHLGRRH